MPDNALSRLQRYIAMRASKPLRQSDDVIHGIYTGTEWEADLLLSDLQAAVAELADARAVLAAVAPRIRAAVLEEAAKVADEIGDEWPDAPNGRHDDWRHGRQDGAMEAAAAIRELGGNDAE